jgi:hypothetical protein
MIDSIRYESNIEGVTVVFWHYGTLTLGVGLLRRDPVAPKG